MFDFKRRRRSPAPPRPEVKALPEAGDTLTSEPSAARSGASSAALSEREPPPRPRRRRVPNVIGVDTRIGGPLTTCEAILIAGQIDGDVTAGDTLTVELGAQIRGNVEGQDIIVRGTIIGDVAATTRLLITQTGRVLGDVQSNAVVVEEGGILEGRCHTGSTESLDPGEVEPSPKAEDSFMGRIIDDSDDPPLPQVPLPRLALTGG
jgi:cytoskeletal protein CcmA (bactofilin family)